MRSETRQISRAMFPLVSAGRMLEHGTMDSAGRHLYVHIPFCYGKCAYCAFYSVPVEAARVDRFLDALERERERRIGTGMPGGCQTLYVGGGTPSVLSAAQWGRLLEILAPVSHGGVAEWTVEANPGTLTAAGLEAMVRAGVNRISLGVQSLDDRLLAAMGRPHRAADVAPTLDLARAAGIENVGMDLIAGLPGADAEVWRRTLAQTVALSPAHVSVYALGVEPGTRLAQQVARDETDVPGDAAVMEALDAAETRLGSAGYERYEISNYAQPGRASLHNLACWRGEDYCGLGPAASSRVGRERWTNHPDLAAYCAGLEAGGMAPCEQERLDERTDLVERLLFRWRLSEGVPVEPWCRAHGPIGRALWAAWRPELRRLRSNGLVTCRGRRWQATPRGREVLDALLERLL
jgi:oxygen-independent coproporphyrinogen-3 oxidase